MHHRLVLLTLTLLLMFFACFDHVQAVKGCVTFVTGNDNNAKTSICDRPDTNFGQIPSTLPKEVVKLTINHQNIEVLDRRQLEHLPNLTYLNLDSNKLSVIRRDAFLPVPHLRELSLRFNHLTLSVDSFHPNALTAVNTLEALNLMRNPIGRVPAHFFYPIRNHLRSLVLAGASPDFHISTEALEGLFKLEVLDLSYNNLEDLPASFSGLFTTMQLKQLFLFGNPWRCDCNLRWLREWAERHNATQYFVDPRGVDMIGYVFDPLLQMEPGSLENAAFPKCASPPRLAGRAIFPIPSVQTNPIATFEMACPPKPKRATLIVRGNIGENVTLTCDFEASSVDEVLWYMNGKPVGSSSRVRVRQVYHGQIAVDYYIPFIQMSDVGTYVCLLKNDFGKANATVTLSLADASWLQGAYSDAGFIGWLDQFNSNNVLKYSSIGAIALIILLIAVGTILFCVCRKNRKNATKALINQPITKTTFTELTPMNGIHTVDGTLTRRRAQPPRYSPSPEMVFSSQHQPYILSFQDNHPLYSMAEHEALELPTGCPLHGMPKSSSSFITTEKSFDPMVPRFGTLDKAGIGTYGGLTTVPVTKIPEMIAPPASSNPLVIMEGPPSSNQNPDYILCPRHGNVVTSLGSPPLAESESGDSPVSPVVRTTRMIKLNPFPSPLKNSGNATPSTTLKTKHVEFADVPSTITTENGVGGGAGCSGGDGGGDVSQTSASLRNAETTPTVPNGTASSGFVTTV